MKNKTIVKRSSYLVVKKIVRYNSKPVSLYSFKKINKNKKAVKPVQLAFPFPELTPAN